MITNFKKNRYKRRLRKLHLIVFSFFKNTFVLTFVAGFIAVSVPMFSAYEAHVINVTARIESDALRIDPPTGNFCNDGNLVVSLNTSLSEVYIIYTLDGSEPDCFLPAPSGHGNLYTVPFPLINNTTVNARICSDDNQSVVAKKSYILSPEYCVQEKRCDSLSIGYWKNHEGCKADEPWSNWTSEIHALSAGEFSGAFASISGKEICHYLKSNNCDSGEIVSGQLCRAKGKALADLSNIVSNHLDLNALIAGADDGDESFDSFGLNSISTVREALIVIESVIANPDATRDELRNAAYISERIYAFYEAENQNLSLCIYKEENLNLNTSTLDRSNGLFLPVRDQTEKTVAEPVFKEEIMDNPEIKVIPDDSTESVLDKKSEKRSQKELTQEKPVIEPLTNEIPLEEMLDEKDLILETSLDDISPKEHLIDEIPLFERSQDKELLSDESPVIEPLIDGELSKE